MTKENLDATNVIECTYDFFFNFLIARKGISFEYMPATRLILQVNKNNPMEPSTGMRYLQNQIQCMEKTRIG